MFLLCMPRILTVIEHECAQITHCYDLTWVIKVFAGLLN